MEMAKLAQEIQRNPGIRQAPEEEIHLGQHQGIQYAAYMRAWVARVERIGNLNYPDEARREQMHGELVLTVGLTQATARSRAST